MPESVASISSTVPWWFYVINFALIIISWLIINIQNNHRETRKEVRQHIDRIIKLIEQFQNESTTYHSAPIKSSEEDPHITQRLSNQIQIIEQHSTLLQFSPTLTTHIKDLRQYCTRYNFEPLMTQEELFPPQEIIRDIEFASANLINELDKQFAKKYW